MLDVVFLYYEDCPSHEQALGRLDLVLGEFDVQTEIKIAKVETEEQARQLEFVGSPTILVNGMDIDPPPADAYYALTCRAYRLEDGRISPLPSTGMIRRAIHAAVSQ